MPLELSCFSERDRAKSVHINARIVSKLLEETDDILCDMDGVLWDGLKPIPGSAETIARLINLGKRVFYVTNSSDKCRQDFVDKLNTSGFQCTKEQVICPAFVIARHLQAMDFTGKVYLVGLEEAVGKELSSLGISYTGTGPDPFEGTLTDWLAMEMDPEVTCVVVCYDPHISFMKMMKACSYLKNPDCMYIASHQDRILPVRGTEKCIPGTGCMVVPISHASNRTPVIIGKPEKMMFEVLNNVHNFNRNRCIMIGDTLTSDIAFAENCGLKSLLVLSGVTSLRDLPLSGRRSASRADDGRQTSYNGYPLPDFYANDLAELGGFL